MIFYGLKEDDRRWLELLATQVGEYARPTFIRFAHEMNLRHGDNKWRGSLPNDRFAVAYRCAFKTTAEIFQKRAPNAAMVWCVNQIWGQLPYSIFYPGDEYVDWVAIDFYHRLNDSNESDYKFFNFFNVALEAKEPDGLDFYTTFSDPNNPKGHKKPMMIAETGASNQLSTIPDRINPGQNWWIDLVYEVSNLTKKYPNLRAILWFGEDKKPDPNAEEIWEEPWAIRDFAHYGATISGSYFLSAPIVDELGRFAATWGEFKQSDLLQNFPNPFNPDTWIPFRLAESAPVRITIYDVAGRLVREFDLGMQAPGDYITRQTAVYWDGRNERGDRVASGIYFYQLSAGNFGASKKLLLLK